MEWLIYFGIIIAIAIFSNYSEQKDKEKLVARLADIPKLVITAEETLFGEEDNLKGRPCFEVKMKGWINHQIEKKLTLHLFIHDNTEVEDNSYGMPLLSTLEVLSEEGSRVFKYQLDINVEVDSFYENFSSLCRIPVEILAAPYKGNRKLKFRLVATSLGVQSTRAGFAEEDFDKIHHVADFDYNYEFKEIGYFENIINRDRIEELSIDLGMCIAAADGRLQQKELDVIKDWSNLGTAHLEKDRAEEKKTEYSKYIKSSYNKAKAKKLSLSDIIEEINEKAGREQKYETLDLLLKIVGADDKLSKDEDIMLNKIVKKLELDEQVFNEMKNKTLATVGKIETSKASVEGLLGIKKNMSDKEKCKELRKQYSKWNSQTNSSNDKIKERAKEMVKIIADLRTKYNC